MDFAGSGSQTLHRGLDVLEAVKARPLTLAELADHLSLNRSTVHRLASALVERGFLRLLPRGGYALAGKLLELGFAVREQMDLPRVARPYLERLSSETEDTVHLGILDRDQALYLDKVPGRRRIEIGSRVGDRHPLISTGLGKALLLDDDKGAWARRFAAEAPPLSDYGYWEASMERYAAGGFAFDLEENEDRIRCVAAPLRDATGEIVAAISVSSAAQYMDDARMRALTAQVKDCAAGISRDLGWQG